MKLLINATSFAGDWPLYLSPLLNSTAQAVLEFTYTADSITISGRPVIGYVEPIPLVEVDKNHMFLSFPAGVPGDELRQFLVSDKGQNLLFSASSIATLGADGKAVLTTKLPDRGKIYPLVRAIHALLARYYDALYSQS